MNLNYHAYLDESGQREYGSPDRHYVIAGLIGRAERMARYEDEITGLKRAFLGTPDIEIKSVWLRQPEECEKHYLKGCGIKQARLDAFVDALYDWLAAAEVRIIAGVVDKEQIQERYGAKAHYANALAYQVFLQRYQKFLASRQSKGAVTCDEMPGKTKAGSPWQELLEKQHRKLKRYGCNLTKMRFTNVSPAVTFCDSSESSLVQLADLAAYNTFRQFKDHADQWDDPASEELDLYEYFEQMLGSFHTNRDGVFAGFGVAKMPRKAKHRWLVPEKTAT